MTAVDELARVRDERPLVADLARVLALAAQIDVALVRHLRTTLIPEADVSTEADLWTSELVRRRSERQLELRDDVRAELWRELGDRRALLAEARAAIEAIRTGARPLLRLEELLIYGGVVGDRELIDRELRRVIAAMRDAPTRRRNLAAWSARALEVLPPIVRETEAARILGSVASAWVATPTTVADLMPDVDSLALVEALQQDVVRVSLYLQRVGDELVVTGEEPTTAHVTIDDVPVANPILVIDQDRRVRIDLHGITRIPVSAARVMVGTLDQRRWWVERLQKQPDPGSISLVYSGAGRDRSAVYLVAPDLAVSCAPTGNLRSIEVRFGELSAGIEVIAVDEDADISLLRLKTPVSAAHVELEPNVEQGSSWQAFTPEGERLVGTVATAWPGITIRLPPGTTSTLLPGTPIFSDAKVIAHVRAAPTTDGLVHTTSARLIKWWLERASSTAPAAETSSTDPPPTENAPPARKPRVWVRTLAASEPPRETSLPDRGFANDDLVVMFGGDPLRWPMAIYRIELPPPVAQQGLPSGAQPRSAPSNTPVRAVLQLALVQPSDALLAPQQEVIRSWLDPGRHRDATSPDVEQQLIDMLLRFAHTEAVPGTSEQLRKLFGEPSPSASPSPVPVVIELPDRISTAGLLGVSLARDGDVRRFRRHRWGGHPVEILTAPQASTGPDAIRVKVTTLEQDPMLAKAELAVRLSRNPGKDAFYRACEIVAQTFSSEVIRGPARRGAPGSYDLELIVNRMPHVSPAHAARRGVQFVVTALDAMDRPDDGRTSVLFQAWQASGYDLAEAQVLVDKLGVDGLVVTWIDLETGVVDLRRDASTPPPEYLLEQVIAAFGDEVRVVFPTSVWNDPLIGRFGTARVRNRRQLEVADGGDTAALIARAVFAPHDPPVIGHVSFYVTSADERIERVRVRATDGTARCEIPRRARGFAVGAIVEDEGILLEAFVDPLPPGGQHSS